MPAARMSALSCQLQLCMLGVHTRGVHAGAVQTSAHQRRPPQGDTIELTNRSASTCCGPCCSCCACCDQAPRRSASCCASTAAVLCVRCSSHTFVSMVLQMVSSGRMLHRWEGQKRTDGR